MNRFSADGPARGGKRFTRFSRCRIPMPDGARRRIRSSPFALLSGKESCLHPLGRLCRPDAVVPFFFCFFENLFRSPCVVVSECNQYRHAVASLSARPTFFNWRDSDNHLEPVWIFLKKSFIRFLFGSFPVPFEPFLNLSRAFLEPLSALSPCLYLSHIPLRSL